MRCQDTENIDTAPKLTGDGSFCQPFCAVALSISSPGNLSFNTNKHLKCLINMLIEDYVKGL
jgi:hypothetical protein